MRGYHGTQGQQIGIAESLSAYDRDGHRSLGVVEGSGGRCGDG